MVGWCSGGCCSRHIGAPAGCSRGGDRMRYRVEVLERTPPVGRAMTLKLPGSIIEEIRRQGEQNYPAECCGVLGGRVGGASAKEVVSATPALNRRTDDPHRYLIAPDDLRRLEAELRAAGLEIV